MTERRGMADRLTGAFRIPQSRVPIIVRRLTGPLTLLAAVVLGVLLLRTFRVEAVNASGTDWGRLAIWIAGALVVTRFLDYAVFDLAFRLRRQVAAPSLLRQLVSLVLFGIAVSIVVKALVPGFALPILTGSAIITAVIGLALQDTLGNLFAGLALHIEKTLFVGDVVRSGESFATVEELSWRAMKLRTVEGNLLLVPNSVAGRDRLEVFPRGGRPVARFLRVGLEYDASPVMARETLESAIRGLAGVASHPERRAYMKSFEAYSVVYELRYWLEDYSNYLEVDSAVRERVWYALHRAGLHIPMPFIRQYQYAGGLVPAESRGALVEPAVAGLDLFAPLSDAERARIAEGAIERRYAPGEIVVREGDQTSSMFIVASGRLGVSIHGAAGDTRHLAVLEAGSAFGEISLLTGEPRTATVRALSETVLVEIEKKTIEPILRQNPSLCGALDAVIAERRRGAASAFDAAREEADRAPGRIALADRIVRFFGLRP
ncbi:MAG: mechanosensitive ion channel family protein [Acidobacteriota bacterium]